MSFHTIELIPFFAIAEALGATAHSRRIAGLMLDLYPKIQWQLEVADKCMSPEFAKPLAATMNYDIIIPVPLAGCGGQDGAEMRKR